MLVLQNVAKRFGSQLVLNDISFEIGKREFVVILGPSGAGKSTLMRCMNGLIHPTSGHVFVNQVEVNRRNLRQVRQKVGFVFQHFNIIGSLSVMQNVLIGTLGYKAAWNVWFTSEERRLAEEAIDRVGLSDKRNVRAEQLSGGQKQRVGIARVLVQRPDILLADEPISSLDPVISREIMDILYKINQSQGTTVICNLHQLHYATKYAQRIIGIQSGKVQYDGPAKSMNETDLQHIYGEKFVAVEEAERPQEAASSGLAK